MTGHRCGGAPQAERTATAVRSNGQRALVVACDLAIDAQVKELFEVRPELLGLRPPAHAGCHDMPVCVCRDELLRARRRSVAWAA